MDRGQELNDKITVREAEYRLLKGDVETLKILLRDLNNLIEGFADRHRSRPEPKDGTIASFVYRVVPERFHQHPLFLALLNQPPWDASRPLHFSLIHLKRVTALAIADEKRSAKLLEQMQADLERLQRMREFETRQQS